MQVQPGAPWANTQPPSHRLREAVCVPSPEPGAPATTLPHVKTPRLAVPRAEPSGVVAGTQRDTRNGVGKRASTEGRRVAPTSSR